MRLFSLALPCGVGAVLITTLMPTPGFSQSLTAIEGLGKAIFFDKNLSVNKNQSCASCHDPAWGWTGPDSTINAQGSVYEGSIPGRFGDRKPPSAAYATQAPILHWHKRNWEGGSFWDGRATGEKLGNPAADQAQGPFLNPVEQALPAAACVVYRVCTASYPVSFTSVWGADACAIAWPPDIEARCATQGSVVPLTPADQTRSNAAFDNIARSIAAYEASPEVNAFTSKFDYATRGGKVKLTREEQRGLALFRGKGNCSNCHVMAVGKPPLFTDYYYDNLGIPKNPSNPVYRDNPAFVDLGLGAFLWSRGYPPSVYGPELGKVKVPTLRNVDKRPTAGSVKAYGHNGYFKSLEEIVRFYNTRDVFPVCGPGLVEKVNCWPPPEYPENVNRKELGNLGLDDEEVAALVAFMKTLSDGYQP